MSEHGCALPVTSVSASYRNVTFVGCIGLLWALGIWHAHHAHAAAAIAIASLLLLGFRTSCRCDRVSDRVSLRWTLLGMPLYTREHMPLSSVTKIDLHHRIRKRRFTSGSNDTWEEYPVIVGGQRSLLLHAPRNYLKARRLAERLAQHLDMRLRDHAFGRVRVRSGDELDLSLGERLRRHHASLPRPELPAGSPFRLLESGPGWATLRLPAQPSEWWLYLFGTAILAILLAAFWTMGGKLPVILLVGPMSVVAMGAMISTFFPRTLMLDAKGLRLRWFIHRKRMRWNDLEEIATGHQSVHLLGDNQVITLPYEFDAGTSGYVRALIEHMARQNAPK